MKKIAFVVALLLLISSDARACGRCRRARRVCYQPAPAYYAHPTYQAQTAYAYPTSQAPVAYAYAPPSIAPPAAPAAPAMVAPTYAYEAQPGGQPAYYYTYDESGKLIIQQWMDWVFRGGRQAGMPRPPLPIIGYLMR